MQSEITEAENKVHFVDIKVSKQLNKTCQISMSSHEQYNCFIFMIEIL